VWQIAARAAGRDLGFAPLLFDRHGLELLLTAELGVSQDRAKALSRVLIGKLDTSFDYFFTPLGELEDGRLAFSPTVVQLGRWQRNIFKIAARQGDDTLAARGVRPLTQLMGLLRANGWRAELNIGLGATDIDVAFSRDGLLFLAQVKVVVEPDGLYETWSVLQKLRHAAGQMQAARAANGVRRACEALGLTGGVPDRDVVCFLLTNAMEFTGAKASGFPIVDFNYLRTLLTGGAIIFADEDGPLELRVPRGGNARRVASLVQRPFHEAFSRRPAVRTREFSFGKYTLVAAMTSASRPEA